MPSRRRNIRFPALQSCSHGEHIKCSPARAELAINLIFRRRAGALLLMEGLISEYSIPRCVQSGMGFPDARGFGKCVPESAFGMGCGFPLDRKWKACPGIWSQSGICFPNRPSSGNYVPESALKAGHAFPTEQQAEIVSQSEGRFWDTLSTNKEGHITWPSTYICSADALHDKPRSNNKASVRAEACKVHREFRTQRGPLNVAPVLRRTVRAGNLTCLLPDRRFSYELAASRYLILVVPGAKLGSVSLASVWKCSVYTFLPSRNIS